MADSIDLAVAWKLQHKEESYKDVSELFGVSKTTLFSRSKGNTLSHQAGAHSALSCLQETELIAQINAYAKRGTLLTPAHVLALAEAVCGLKLGRNWAGRFIKRHKDVISSRFHAFRDISRLKADTPSTRDAWYTLVSVLRAFRHVTIVAS